MPDPAYGERPCGIKEAAPGRCHHHVDRRSAVQQLLDPLGPYVARVLQLQGKDKVTQSAARK